VTATLSLDPETTLARALSNAEIARALAEIAGLLEAQGASVFRVQAYRRAAEYVAGFDRPLAAVLEEGGVRGLVDLPTIGWAIAAVIRELRETGRSTLLDRLRGESDAASLLATVPAIGPVLAERLHAELGIDTLEDLEVAAHDGRLAALPAFGPKRLAAVRDTLAARLGLRRAGRRRPPLAAPLPAVAELLAVDREYRDRAAAGELARIAPRRFNPTGEAWLPILHTTRDDRHYTALFSNTARAHELGRTRDWVVIYADGRDGDHQWTVVTAPRGPFRGRRVVRGREAECYTLFRERAHRRAMKPA
jgi:hypothetical protein